MKQECERQLLARALTRLIMGQKKVEGIGFMTMEDVQRFLDEVCDFFGEETRGEYGMKQCPNCGDIALEEFDKDNGYAGTCSWEVFEDTDTEDE